MLSATFGILGPVAAAILHQVGSLLVLLNSMRLLVFGDWAELPPLRQLRGLGAWIGRLDDRIDLDGPGSGRGPAPRGDRLGGVAGPARLCDERLDRDRPDEVGVLQRFGRFEGVLRPGLHLRWPYPIERVTRSRPIACAGSRSASASRSRRGEPTRWESSHGRLGATASDD